MSRGSRSFSLLVLALLAVGTVTLNGSADAQEEFGQQNNQVVNIEFILDSSGSMANVTDTGETRMEAAKRVLHQVIQAIPDRQGSVNVGFRIYGFEGNNSDTTKQISCNSSELRVPIQGIAQSKLLQAIDQAQPTGWTPIARSLALAAKDFPPGGKSVTNNIVLLTDGTETCDGNPCQVATSIHNSPGKIVTDVIGFGTTPEDQQTLSCIADNGGGLLLGAGNADQLRNALFSVLEQLQVVVGAGFVGGNAFSLLPQGEPGKLSVIAYGPVDDLTHQLPMVIRNNTGNDIVGPKVSVTVRDSSGGLLGAGDALSIEPYYVRAGGVAFGAISFLSDTSFPADATYEFKVTSTPPSQARFYPSADLDIVEAAGFPDHIAGTVKNGYDKEIKGPLQFAAVCFDDNGNVLNYDSGFSDIGQLAPGETQSFQIDLLAATLTGAPCPAYLVAGQGFGTPSLPTSGSRSTTNSAASSPAKPQATQSPRQATVPAQQSQGPSSNQIAISMIDILFQPDSVTIPANTPVTLTLTNNGVLPHNFSVDSLHVSVDVAPGQTQTVTITAPAGTYQFYCNVPGHAEAGMVGTLTAE